MILTVCLGALRWKCHATWMVVACKLYQLKSWLLASWFVLRQFRLGYVFKTISRNSSQSQAPEPLKIPIDFPYTFKRTAVAPNIPGRLWIFIQSSGIGSPRDFTPARVGDGVRVGIAEIIAKLRQNVEKEILYEPKPKRWATCGFPGRQIWVFFLFFVCLQILRWLSWSFMLLSTDFVLFWVEYFVYFTICCCLARLRLAGVFWNALH